jgi:hypothetical protein
MYNEKAYEGLDKEALLTILSESEKLANVGGRCITKLKNEACQT